VLVLRVDISPVNLKGKIKGSKLINRRSRSVHSHDVLAVRLVSSGDFSTNVDMLGERKS